MRELSCSFFVWAITLDGLFLIYILIKFPYKGLGGLDGLRGPRNPDDVCELDGMWQKMYRPT